MPYRLTLATPAVRDLVVEAMRSRADTLKRAATRGAGEVNADRAAGRDVRSRAVKLVTLLGEASDLEALALELEHAEDVPLVEPVGMAATTDQTGAPLALVEDAHVDPTPDVELPFEPPTPAGPSIIDTIEELADLAGLNPATLDDGSDDEEAEGLASEDTAATLNTALGTP